MSGTAGTEIVRKLELRPEQREGIAKIVSDVHYVEADTTIGELSTALGQASDVDALGVVDAEGRTLGLLDRAELFNLLGRPFGLDVLRRKPVRELMQDAVRFHYERNIFSVSDIIDGSLRSAGREYFLLVDEQSRFRGIFSSIDMLMFLSDITRKDIALARSLQNRIVREEQLIEGPGFALLNATMMAKGVGGDFHAGDAYAGNRLFYSVCDVSGKGVAAALLTSAMWGIYSQKSYRRSMEEFIRDLNGYLFRTFEAERFVTGIFADLDAGAGTLDLCDMGHSYIYLWRGGNLHTLKIAKSNPPLGIFPEMEISGFRFRLEPGDLILIVTDGLTEQTDSKGGVYDMKRVRGILNESAGQDLRELKTALIEDFFHFRGTQAQHDDVTLSLLRFAGNKD